jgi:hypothetical protein
VLHKDDPIGEAIGYVAPLIIRNTIFLVPGDYTIYPVFTRFNPVTQELMTAIPTFEGQPSRWTFNLTDNNSSFSVNISDIPNQGNLTMTSGGAYLKIINNSSTAIRLWDGYAIKNSSTGTSFINPTLSEIFSLDFTRNHDDSYPSTQSLAQLFIGTSAYRLEVPTQAYELDYIYKIEVTGTVPNLQFSPIVKGDKVDLSNIFSAW